MRTLLPYKRKRFNVNSTVHGSTIMCLAENVHGVAVLWNFNPKQQRMVTKTTELIFVRPGRSDLFVEFHLDENSVVMIDLVFESRVTDTSGNIVAELRNCYHFSKKR